jgi:hypothetical protein
VCRSELEAKRREEGPGGREVAGERRMGSVRGGDVGQGRTKVHDVDVCWSELAAET